MKKSAQQQKWTRGLVFCASLVLLSPLSCGKKTEEGGGNEAPGAKGTGGTGERGKAGDSAAPHTAQTRPGNEPETSRATSRARGTAGDSAGTAPSGEADPAGGSAQSGVPRAQGAPEGSAETSRSASPPESLSIPEEQRIEHGECTKNYKLGTLDYRSKKWARAVSYYVKYVSGKCFGRTTNATDVWLAHRAFMSACRTPDKRYRDAFQRLHEKACNRWGSKAPCSKPLKCPANEGLTTACNTLYKKGTKEFKAKDQNAALTTFQEYLSKGCFGRLTASTDLWVSYRAIKAAKALGKDTSGFMAKLKATCAKKKGWPCKKLLK